VKITGFQCVNTDGKTIMADAHGNNLAFSCPKCSHPVLAVIREHQRGSSSSNPTVCKGCASSYWFEVLDGALIIKNL